MAETKPPKVFISYAWEDDLKIWALDFSTRLRSDGINAILDQWETVPGDQLTQFMEKSVRESDFVVFICTPTYKRKSDRRKGGVGYEGSIITGEVFQKNNHRKFIPVLRKGKWATAAPSWASSKLYIDFGGEPYSEASYQQLLNTLFGKSPTAPPLRDDTLREKLEREAAENAERDRTAHEKEERDVIEKPIKYPFARLKGMQEFMEFARDPDWRPSLIDISLLKKLRMAKGREVSMIQALRFLGVIDDMGTPTNEFDNLKKDYQVTLMSLVQEKYSDLLNTIPLRKVNQAQLVSYFGTPVDIAEYQAKLFIWFCEQSGVALPKISVEEKPARKTSQVDPNSVKAKVVGRDLDLPHAKLSTTGKFYFIPTQKKLPLLFWAIFLVMYGLLNLVPGINNSGFFSNLFTVLSFSLGVILLIRKDTWSDLQFIGLSGFLLLYGVFGGLVSVFDWNPFSSITLLLLNITSCLVIILILRNKVTRKSWGYMTTAVFLTLFLLITLVPASFYGLLTGVTALFSALLHLFDK